MIKSLTMNSIQAKRPVAAKKSNVIVSKNSHRVWCIIKVQSVIRRWLAIRLLKKLRQEKLLSIQQRKNNLIVPLSPLSSISSPEIITISFNNSSVSNNYMNKNEEKNNDNLCQISKSEEEIKIETLDINTQVRDDVKVVQPIIKIEQQPIINTTTTTAITNENGSNTTPYSSRSSSISSAISMSSSLSSSSLASSESTNQQTNQHQAPLTLPTATLTSSTTSSTSISSPRNITLRKRTIDELLNVERSYVNDMNTLIDVFYTPFKTEESFPKEYLFTLFCNIEEIQTVHSSFLESLEKRLSQWNEATVTVGDLFLPFMGSFQKLYEVYINNYENAFAFIRYIKTSPLYSDVQKSILNKERDNRCRSLDLCSFLVMPIQRLPRYIVLLKEIEKNTQSAHHPDLQQCALTLVQLQDLTLYLNESKRGSTYSNEDKVAEIKQSIDGLDSLVGSNAKFIMEGPLALLKGVVASSKKELYVYLFKEFILCTENQSVSTNKKISSLKYSKTTSSALVDNNYSNNSSPSISHHNSSNNLNPNRTSSLFNLSGPSNTSSTNSSPSSSGLSSPNLNGATQHHNHSTIRNRSLFKKILFSDVKALSVLKNFKDSIQVVTSKKVYTFVANSAELREKWYNSFNDCLCLRTPPPSPTLPRGIANKLVHLNSGDLSNSLSSSSSSTSSATSTSTTQSTSNRHSIQLQSSPNFQSPTISKKKNRFSIQLT